jgi:hypothetical protein
MLAGNRGIQADFAGERDGVKIELIFVIIPFRGIVHDIFRDGMI